MSSERRRLLVSSDSLGNRGRQCPSSSFVTFGTLFAPFGGSAPSPPAWYGRSTGGGGDQDSRSIHHCGLSSRSRRRGRFRCRRSRRSSACNRAATAATRASHAARCARMAAISSATVSHGSAQRSPRVGGGSGATQRGIRAAPLEPLQRGRCAIVLNHPDRHRYRYICVVGHGYVASFRHAAQRHGPMPGSRCFI